MLKCPASICKKSSEDTMGKDKDSAWQQYLDCIHCHFKLFLDLKQKNGENEFTNKAVWHLIKYFCLN